MATIYRYLLLATVTYFICDDVRAAGIYPIRYPPKVLSSSEGSICPAAEELQMALEDVNADIRDILREIDCPTPSPATCECSDEPGTTMFEADLRRGASYTIDSPPDMNMSFVVDFEPSDPGIAIGNCNQQGVLKITYPILSPQTRLLRFDMYFNSPTGWNFNIGDSSTNNGFGGDAFSTHDEAEVHNLVNDDFRVYRNNLRGCDAALHAQFSNAITDFVTVTIGDEYVEFDNHQGIKECYRSECLFALAGQMAAGTNYDIFFGMNRVISGPGSRTGTGLCRVLIKYLDCNPSEVLTPSPSAVILPTSPPQSTQPLPTPTSAICECSEVPDTTIFQADLSPGGRDYTIDAPPDMNLSFVADFELPEPTNGTCNFQGVLKITYPILSPQTRLLRFDMYFNSPTGWNFNIGDSSTNNGFGGDAFSTHDEAEVHNLVNDDFRVYRNNLRGCDAALHAQFSNAITDFVTVTIGDEYVEFDNHQGIKECYRSECLFALAGQMAAGTNYDIFFGMNRVISGPGSRTGTGLCRVEIKYLDCRF